MMLRERLRSRRSLLTAVGLVVAVSAGLGAGLGIIATAAVADGARAVIADARGDEAVVRVAIRWAGQSPAGEEEAARAAAAQDAAVRDAMAALLPRAGLDPVVSIRSEAIELTVVGREADPAGEAGAASGEDDRTPGLVLLSDDRVHERSELVAGSWPESPESAALEASAAGALGIEVGDRVRLPGQSDSTVELAISALWRAVDAGDPAWAGDPLITSGVTGSTVGPLLVDPAVWRTLDTRPIAQWVAVLDPARATPAVLDELAAGLPALARTIDDDERSQGTGIVVDGALAGTVAEVQQAAAGVEAIIPMVLGLIAVAALTTLFELQRLLSTMRREETTLLRSRGASPRRLATSAAGESVIVALPSAGAGAAVGTLLALATRPGALDRLADDPTALVAGAAGAFAVMLAAVLLATVITARSARTALRRDTLVDSGRARRTVSAAALVLSVIAAAVAVGQFVLYRGPVVPTAAGGASVDLVAALAPVLLLLAGALAAVVLFEPVARFAARVSANDERLMPVLVTRSLARSVALVTAPVVLMTLAIGASVVAVAVDATTRSAASAARELVLGAPLTVSGTLRDAELGAALGGPSGTVVLAARPWSVAPVVISELSVAEAPGTLVALDPSTLRTIAASAGGEVDPPRIAAAITTAPLPGPEVAATAAGIRLIGDGVRADFWVADARGAVSRIASGADGVAALPAEGGPWRVLALDVTPTSGADDAGGVDLDVVLSGVAVIAADGTESVQTFGEVWNARPGAIDRFGGDARPRTDGLSGFTATVVRTDPGAVRVMPDPAELRFAVTAAVAERFDAGVGDRIFVSVPGSSRRVDGVIGDIVPAVPGGATAAAVAVDLAASVQRQLTQSASPLTATTFWLAPTDGAGLDPTVALRSADELRDLLPGGVTVQASGETAADALAEGARAALWTAALGALLLALATAATVSRAIVTARELDVVVLRAVGIGARLQARARALELIAVLGAASFAGLVVGAATSAVVVGDLARTLIVDAPAALALAARVDPLVLGGLLLVLVFGVAALGVGAGHRAARQVATLSAREVLR